MAAVTVRNISDETHRALKARARAHGRSTEAEIRAILDDAVRSEQPVRLGSLLAEIGADAGGVELDTVRSREPYTPLDLS